jgi:hypothetical protein
LRQKTKELVSEIMQIIQFSDDLTV